MKKTRRAKRKRMFASACIAAPTLFAASTGANANVLPSEIINGDFEMPDLVGFGMFIGEAPGWEFFDASGVQTESVPPFDNGVGFMNNGFSTRILQQTSHVIADGEMFALQADIFTRYDATEVTAELYAMEDGEFVGGPFASAILDNSTSEFDGLWTRMLPIMGTAGAAQAGHLLGISFRNTSGAGEGNNGGQVHIDNVTSVVGPSPDGDYNGNGVVDAADYTVWRDTLGQAGAGLAADGDGDQMITTGDYDFWKERFGQSSGSGGAAGATAAVPEPSSLGLLCGALLSVGSGFLTWIGRGRRRSNP